MKSGVARPNLPWNRILCATSACLLFASLVAPSANTSAKHRAASVGMTPAGQYNSKGAVEFYDVSPFVITIYKVQEGKTTKLGATSSFARSRLARLRFTEMPGTYTYAIKAGGVLSGGRPPQQTVQVSILEGMLTPIRVVMRLMDTMPHGTGGYTKYYEMEPPIVGKPIPLNPGPDSLESFMADLENEDWGTRLYAVEALGTMGKLADERTRERITQLAANDSDELVRKASKKALENIQKGSR